jgi:multidrug efflux pump subunit AcrA (membrane-fusion protein)
VQPQSGAAVLLRARFANRTWEWQGRIVRTDANIDVNSRLVYAVAEVVRPFAREEGSERPPLAPGLFVSAIISGRELPGVAVLPRSALRSDGTVMLVDRGQRAREQAVHVLDSSPERAWVQGLEAGDRVIVRESTLTVAGMEVTVNNVTQLAGGAN